MATEIYAPLSGKIVLINIKVGDKVEEDDEVLIIEAMKMETPIFAPCDGMIQEIKVNKGDNVQEDDILALIE